MYLTTPFFVLMYYKLYITKGTDGMDLSLVIFELIVDPIEAIIIMLLYVSLINRKDFIRINKGRTLSFIIAFTLFTCWATIYLPFGFHTICITIFLIFTLSFITKVNTLTSAISIGMILILFAVTEMCIANIGMIFFHFSFGDVIHNFTYRLYFVTIAKTIQIIITIYVYRKNIVLYKHDIFKRTNNILAFVILQMFIMVNFIITLDYVVDTHKNTAFYQFLLLAIQVIFIFFAYLDYREREKIINLKNKLILQEEYVNNMEETMNVVRRERDEFDSHLNTIYALSTMNKPNSHKKIQSYIRKLNGNMKLSNVFYHTGNDYVDGLLAVKTSYAYAHNIHLEVDIETPLFEAKVEDGSLTNIIGNIIDNAFEAFKRINKRNHAVVSICAYRENKKYYLSIANNGPKIPEENLSRIFENGYTTKKKHPRNHGYGLYIVRQFVKRNDGKITVKSSDEETEFLIEFDTVANINKNRQKEEGHLRVVK